jgi:hypothetical protein
VGPTCAASDLVRFRNCLGDKVIAKLFALSALHADKVKKSKEVMVDTAVQEKTSPSPPTLNFTENLLRSAIPSLKNGAFNCASAISLWFIGHAQQALKKLLAIAGWQVRDLQRNLAKLGQEELYVPRVADHGTHC